MTRKPRLLSGLRGCGPSLALIATCLAPVAATAQSDRGITRASHHDAYVHESWTVQDGLPVNAINGLLQSRNGYVWAVTFDGLVRFDGVRFTVFNSANSEGLPSNRILAMLEADDGSMWLRTEQFHLVRFRDGVFTHFGPDRGLTDQVYTMYEDLSGVLWVGTNRGIGIIRDERFVTIGDGAVAGPVESIIQRRDGTVWVGTTASGLFRLAGERTAVVGAPKLLEAGMIRALYEDPSGTLWIGGASGVWSERAGVIRAISSSRPLINVVRFLSSPASRIVLAYAQSGVFELKDGLASTIDGRNRVLLSGLLWADSEGAVWHATGPELYRNGSRVYALNADPGYELPPTTISSALFDHEGSLWIGTHAAGLHRLKPALFNVYSEPEGLAYRNVYAVYEDRSATMWIGTWGGGANRIDTRGRISSYRTVQGNPANINSFYQDETGAMWTGAANGLFTCVPPAPCRPAGPPEIRDATVLAIHGDKAGRIWVGTTNGLFSFAAGKWTRLSESAGAPKAPVRAFAETRDGALWLGTNGGGVVRHGGNRFTTVTTADQLPSDVIRSLYVDADGWLWIGTEGRGLARLDPRAWDNPSNGDRRIVRFTVVDGLFDEVIHQILEDDFGRLWMSTNRGIFWVARAELNAFADGRIASIRSTSYTERDGLRNREANGGVQPAGVKARDGRLWFPTQDGVAVVDPARIESNRIPPPLVVERVVAQGTALQPGSTPLKLAVDQRDIQIEYTALSFIEPANVRFRYRLDPYDDAWVDAGNRRTAFYTRVPPGKYNFRVEASNNEGIWNEAGAAVEFSVAPRLWELRAFRLLLVLLLAAAIAGVFRWRYQRLRQRARELERVVAERTGALKERERQLAAQNAMLATQAEQLHELDRAKSRFFANVSHEFRTPLTLTIGPLEDMRAKLGHGDASAQGPLDMALRNARRLLRLVNQILDVAKLEAGQMKLRRRMFDLVPFVRGITSAFAAVAERNGITLTASTPDSIQGSFDSDALEKILTNLLSNAIKFTPAGGQVALALIQDGESVRLRVSDSGPGIPSEHLAHVFERFYQVDESNTRAQPGTGIGLSLAKELVELHGGTITVESAGANAGATFTATLPLGYQLGDALAASADTVPAAWEAAGTLVDDSVNTPAGAASNSEDVTTLLIVDDSADLRAYMREHFVRRFRVIEAGDGAEGAALAREHLPDVVISDVMMPVADGHELCRVLRSSPETDFIPVILLTAQATTEHKIAGLERGADDYIVKPFEMRELEARVDNLIASRRRLRERFAKGHVELRPRGDTVLPADQEFIDRVRTAIEANLADADFGVAELAKAVFQDRSHLFRRIRELLAESPSELIRRLRLARAEQLLGDETATVADVAYAVGFNSVSYFCRCFQDIHGVTPAVFRGRLIPR